MVTTAFVNGAVFDGHRYLGAGPTCWSRTGVSIGRERRATLDRAGASVVDLAGGLVSPGFTDAHVHPIQGGLERLRCDLSEHVDARGVPRRDQVVRRGEPRARVDPRRRLGDAGVPRRHPDRRPTSTRWSPTGRRSCPTATITAPGSTRRALELAGIDRDTPDPADGRIERDADGHPDRHAPRGRDVAGVAARAAHERRRTTTPACWRGSATSTRVGVTGWQDAIVGSYAGMDDPGATYVKAAANGDLRSHVVGALWWERAPRGRAGRGPRRPPRGAQRRALPGGSDQGDAGRRGRERHGVDARRPTSTPAGRETENRGHSFVEAGALREAVAALDAAGLPGARARDRRPGLARGARRLRGHATAGPAPPHRAHPGRPPRRRPALRRARRGRQHAGAVGLRGRADVRAHAAVPRSGAVARGSTRSATSTARRRGW